MARTAEATGKTIEEAIAAALNKLGVGREEADIEILDEGNKGLLGFIGSKTASVRATIKPTDEDRVIDFLYDIFTNMGIEVEIEAFIEEETLKLNLVGNQTGTLIGHRGETLDALQYLASLVYNKNDGEYRRVTLDTANYRKKREEILIGLAHRIAAKVQKYRKSVTLEPMNPYERRIIHSTLQSDNYVKTYSVGEEPNRKVVIACK